MSWAKNNPEKWDEVCCNGIVCKIEDTIKWYGGEVIDHETIDDAVHAIRQDPNGDKVFDALMVWANKEIGGQIDGAMRARGPT